MTHPATLIKNSFRAYIRDIRAWLIITLPIAAIMSIFIILDWIQSQNPNWIVSILKNTGSAPWIVFFGIATLIIIAAIIFVSRCFSSAVIFSSYDSLNGQKPKFKTSYMVGYKTFWPVLWVAVLRGLIVLGGLLLLIVPGIIWALQYSLATQVAIIENKHGMNALRRSKELINGRMFEALINYGVIGLIIGYGAWLVTMAIIVVIMVLGALIALAIPGLNYQDTAYVSGYIIILIQMIIIWLAIPLSPLAIMSVYKDFSEKQ